MARGYSSLHPIQEGILREIGIPSEAVTQGWGYASASAGYHAPEGVSKGRRFSSCMDLAVEIAESREPFNRLVQAGVCPFLRTPETGWRGSPHIHCVTVGLRDDQGRVTILPGPRSQIRDFIAGLNGLANHAPLTGPWVPTVQQRLEIRGHYENWAPDLATGVYLGDRRIPCYAWYEGGVVRCDVRRLAEGLGGRVIWDGARARVFAPDGREVRLTTGRLEGDYYRANVREVAEAFGYDVRFTALSDGTACRVDLVR